MTTFNRLFAWRGTPTRLFGFTPFDGPLRLAGGFLLLSFTGLSAAPHRDYPIQPLPFTEVAVADAFWSPRLATNAEVTIPYAFKKCEETGRIDNFAKAGGLKEGKFEGIFFNDSDVYKVLEGAAYALAIRRDPQLEAYVDDVIKQIAAAQEPDGYLYTARTLCGKDYMPPGGKERWSNISGGHELYNVGHMYEAAVAYFQATGKRTLLEVALKNADLICQVFGPGKREDPPGHEEIEIGLARLYRVTGNEKYLRQSKFFLDARGRAEGHRLYGEYSQDHKPVVEQEEAVGHSVRAAYLYTGMADVAALTGDAAYVTAIERIWQDVVGRKLYLTGGIGAAGGHEGFGEEYFLPNRTAYSETCASVANAMWNHRMFLYTGDGRYLDVAERVIYNAFLAGISMKGDRFFYPNRLESQNGAQRAAWFGCACCPANIVRFVPSVPGYAYASKPQAIYVNLFLGGTARLKIDGQTVTLRQETRYPWDGRIKITVHPERDGSEFAVHVRIPGWARNEVVPSDLYRFARPSPARPSLRINQADFHYVLEKGYAPIRRAWRGGDTIELNLPMPVRRVLANDRVVDDRGRVALQRGPIVYCVEGHETADHKVLHLLLEDDAPVSTEFRADLLNGVQVLHGKARVVKRAPDGAPQLAGTEAFTAIPYYAWAHRQPAQMAVWLARELAAAKPLPAATIAYQSTIQVSRGGPKEAINDQLEPRNSIDHGNPFFHWWPQKGTTEWVEYHFAQPTRVSGVEVYWFDDTGIGQCRLPQSWKLLAQADGQWQEVRHPSGYGVKGDQYNRTTFDPLTTTGLRLEVQLRKKWSAGIHEWKVIGTK